MPLYDVSVDFTLDTEIEVDLGYRQFDSGDAAVQEFSDDSYFSTQSVEADGGALRFAIESESAEQAEERASEIISDGIEVEDSNGLTWLVSNVSFDIEKREIPMDLDRATTLVEAYLAQMEGMDDDLKEAFGFLMDTVVDQARRAVELASTITELRSENTRLGTLLTELQVAEAQTETV